MDRQDIFNQFTMQITGKYNFLAQEWLKKSRMTKEEIRTNLTPHMHHFHDCKEWRDAFKMYNELHKTKLKPNCGRCFETVREWVKR